MPFRTNISTFLSMPADPLVQRVAFFIKIFLACSGCFAKPYAPSGKRGVSSLDDSFFDSSFLFSSGSSRVPVQLAVHLISEPSGAIPLPVIDLFCNVPERRTIPFKSRSFPGNVNAKRWASFSTSFSLIFVESTTSLPVTLLSFWVNSSVALRFNPPEIVMSHLPATS